MKRTPQTAKAYAKYLYMASRARDDYWQRMTEVEIADCRVRAFVEGVNWERRRERAAQSELDGKA